jgi:hypothetical protein
MRECLSFVSTGSVLGVGIVHLAPALTVKFHMFVLISHVIFPQYLYDRSFFYNTTRKTFKRHRSTCILGRRRLRLSSIRKVLREEKEDEESFMLAVDFAFYVGFLGHGSTHGTIRFDKGDLFPVV